MKYLKLFENISNCDHWELGSYVLVDLLDFNDPESQGLPKTRFVFGQITKWLIADIVKNFEVTIENGVKIRFQNNKIIRYLTPDEIEQYKIKLETNKYNL